MTIFQKISEHEQVLFCNDPHTGLKAIIAIHDTTLGPALGGCRMHPYATEEEALQDVLRLSKGMTYKCAAADVDFGGGKAVIIGDPQRDKSPELFRSFGQFVSSLKGRFYTGTDMGTTPEDFVHAYKETECIVGLPEAYGGHGDSSVPTAWGVLQGLRAVCHYLWGSDDLSRRSYAVQGLGKVGFKVAEQLLARGAHLYVTDLDPQVVNRLQKRGAELKGSITPVEGEAIYSVAADIFVPCAIGGIINETNIEQLKVKAVCGSANNQLWTDQCGQLLHERSILYAPDYIVNAGGLIQVADELYGPNKERVKQKTEAIYDTLFQIFVSSEERGISTVEAANQFVEERLWRRARFNNFYSPAEKPKWRVRR